MQMGVQAGGLGNMLGAVWHFIPATVFFLVFPACAFVGAWRCRRAHRCDAIMGLGA